MNKMIKRLTLLFIALMVNYCLIAQTFKVIDNDTINRVDVSGLKQGHWIEMNQFESRGSYKDGIRDGQWLTYFGGNYIQKIENYQKGKFIGGAFEFDRWGRLIAERYYMNGVSNGVSKTFTADGFFTSFTEYKDGKINGVKKIYYQDSPDKVMEEAHYKNDIKDGPSKWFTKEGRLVADYNYQNGLLEGDIKTYYPSGKLLLLEHYNLNNHQGEAIEYFESGKEKRKGIYKNDLKEGEWTLYDENQNVISKERYKEGSLLKK
jgi:antitoxin component YwqK of YwqJK toxin-antitoxin module